MSLPLSPPRVVGDPKWHPWDAPQGLGIRGGILEWDRGSVSWDSSLSPYRSPSAGRKMLMVVTKEASEDKFKHRR